MILFSPGIQGPREVRNIQALQNYLILKYNVYMLPNLPYLLNTNLNNELLFFLFKSNISHVKKCTFFFQKKLITIYGVLTTFYYYAFIKYRLETYIHVLSSITVGNIMQSWYILVLLTYRFIIGICTYAGRKYASY